MTDRGFEQHDHAACIANAMGAAERHCAEAKLQFTPARREVLSILLDAHRAMGAYDILDKLKEGGRSAQPPVVYRALDFLMAHGFAHRIERLNAYIACSHPGANHAPAFLICRSCQTVAEAPSGMMALMGDVASEAGFRLETVVMEAEGLCPRCDRAEKQA
ncbi:transcriptional repressor [Pontivivens ytuae]|uniref:Transcriptional repressor n=1 Tax=Pontivivens ytuae TaxID=2789856 RepID=A0A7S9LNZ9_9RHOB|nr:transcriptional repressor [Pontivivens ytuae]QPH52624.1 transcriptional repressor [Pontivivens ytuae]